MIEDQTVSRRSSTFIAPDEKIHPLGDKIFLRPLDFKPSEIIECVRFGRPVRGQVVAVGPGTNPKIYREGKSKFVYSNVFVKTQVKPGDIVEIGGLNIFDGKGYSFDEVIYGTERLLVISEKDVAILIEGHRKTLTLPKKQHAAAV